MGMLDILEPVQKDQSITRYEFRSYAPYSTSSLNKNDEVRICVQNQGSFLYPHESYLLIEGRVAALAHVGQNQISFTKNFLAFLFSEIRLELNGIAIDQVKSPGTATCMKNYVTMTYSQLQHASEFSWHEATPMALNDTFSYCIPMKLFGGFFADYQKILIFAKLELVLLRSRTDNDCVFRAAIEGRRASELDVQITKINWMMPHVEVDDLHKLKLLKVLEKGVMISIPFRSWEYFENPQLPQNDRVTWQVKTSSAMHKPLYVILGFQTGRRNSTIADASDFDHCNIRNAKLFLNSQQYPYEQLNLNFNANNYSVAYKMFCNFLKSYSGSTDKQLVDKANYRAHCPLIVFDCSRNESIIKSSAVDVRIEMEFHANVPANTVACCLMIHDQIVKYNPFTNIVERDM